MEEIWKDVVGAEGWYQVSSLGRIYSKPRDTPTWKGLGTPKKSGGVILQPTRRLAKGGCPRWIVNLAWPGRVSRFSSVQVLILEAFVGPRPKGMVARHKNLDRDDLRADNLEWATKKVSQQDRIARGTHCPGESHWRCQGKRTGKDVCKMRKSYKQGKTATEIAKGLGISPKTVENIVKKYTWKYTECCQ